MERHILIVGYDDRLQETRVAVLKQRWSASCVRPDEALRRIQTEDPDLLILCHTLSAQQVKALVSVCQERFPEVRILALQSRSGSPLNFKVDATVVVPAPEGILKAVDALLVQPTRR
jgi:DNA-binding response OmpR family regulator